MLAEGDPMDADEAYRFVEQQGVVLESASGPVPTLTHHIVGERIRGSWWSHPASHHIYACCPPSARTDLR